MDQSIKVSRKELDVTDEKSWYQSKTIWGALIAVAASMSGSIGYSISPANQAELAQAMVQLVGAVGALVAVYGRLSATDIIN